jgi:hypothetical protein
MVESSETKSKDTVGRAKTTVTSQGEERADWKQNKPFPLKSRSASEWAKLPHYYVMEPDRRE